MGLALALRLIGMWAIANYHDPDDWEYGEIASNIVTGKGFARQGFFDTAPTPTSSHAPLYPYVLAAAKSLFPGSLSYIMILLLQVILSTLLVPILYRIVARLFSRTSAIITACGVAIYPPLIYYAIVITPTTIFVFLLSSTLYLLLALRSGGLLHACCTGVVYGLTLLCNAVGFAVIPAVILWAAIRRHVVLRELLLAAGITLIVLLPWTLRNYRVHKTLIPVTTQLGVNLWIGNNPNATGTDYYRVVDRSRGLSVLLVETLPRAEKQKLMTMTEVQRMNYFLTHAGDYVWRSPLEFLELLLKKSVYFWWFSPSSINGSVTAIRYRGLYIFVYVPLLLFAVLGISIFAWEQRPIDLSLILGIIVFTATIYSITHVGLSRYRIPIELLLIPLASFSMNRIFGVLRT